MATSSSYHRDLRQSLDKSRRKNDESSTKKSNTFSKSPQKDDDFATCTITKISGKSKVSIGGKTAVDQKCKKTPKIKE
jgi:hypothetical protein